MPIKLEISANLSQAISQLRSFGTEIDRQGGVTVGTAQKIETALSNLLNDISQFNKVSIKNPLEDINTDGLTRAFSKITDIDFSSQLDQVRQKVNDAIEKNVNSALGITVETNVDTAPAIKSIQQLEAEMDELKTRINQSTNIGEIQKLAVQFGALQAEANKLKSVFTNISDLKIDPQFTASIPATLIDRVNAFGGGVKATIPVFNQLQSTASRSLSQVSSSFDKVGSRSFTARFAVQNLSNVLRDIPFAAANPAILTTALDHVIASFTALKAEAGTASGALNLLKSQITGGGGLLLGFTALSSLAAILIPKLFGMSDAEKDMGDEAKQAAKDLKDLLSISSTKISLEAAGSLQGDIEKVKALSAVVLDQTETYKKRNAALEQLKGINKNYFGDLTLEADKLTQLKEKVNDYTNALIAAAIVREFSDDIGKVSKQLFLQQNTVDGTIKKIGDYATALKLAKERNNDLRSKELGYTTTDVSNAQNNLGKTIGLLKDQTKAVGDLQKQKDLLTKGLQDAVKETLKFPPLTDTNPTGASSPKDKFEFLFGFLPFDVNGKLKPEQKQKLLDAIDKFQKDFSGIIQGANFIKNGKVLFGDEKIQAAKELDLKLKAGTVQFDLPALRSRTLRAFDNMKPEDLLPPDKLDALSKQVVDEYIKGFQDESERIKNANIFGNIDLFPSISKTIDQAKLDLLRIGQKLPQEIQALDVFGNPITVTFDELFDFTKISPAEAIKAIRKAVSDIKTTTQSLIDDINTSFQQLKLDAFITLGESIGQAIGSGANFFQIAARNFASLLGDFVELIGKDLIKYGIIKEGLDKIIKGGFALPGAAAIALGVAAVAVGAAIKSSFSNLQKFNRGGIVPGQGNTDSVPALLTPGELVIPKDQVSKVQKLLKESVSFKLPSNLFGSLGLNESFNQIKKLATFQFSIPQLSIPTRNTDISSPLSRVPFALGGAALQPVGSQQLVSKVSGKDLMLILKTENRSNQRNFGKSNF